MKNYYQEEDEHSEEECIAQLTIRVSKDEEVTFGCNWESDEQGIQAVAGIFYGMAYDNLAEQILNHLKEQCVLEDTGEEFMTIMQSIKDLILSNAANTSENSSGENLAVSPRGVLRL